MQMPTDEDMAAIQVALQWMLDNSPGPQMKFADMGTAMAYIEDARQEGRARMWEGYLLLYHIGSPWYSRAPYFIEELVIRVHKTEKTSAEVVRVMEGIARSKGCVFMAVGDTQIGRMAKIYTAEGFTPIGTQFVKEL